MNDKPIKMTTVLFIGIFLFYAIASYLIVIETIPDNAKIFVYPSQRKWAPNSFFMKRDFDRQLSDPKLAEGAKLWLVEQTPSIYSEVKSNGKYAGYSTFPVLLEPPGDIRIGQRRSLFSSWFVHDKRWNDDGSWNW